jgi:hypothetical protein
MAGRSTVSAVTATDRPGQDAWHPIRGGWLNNHPGDRVRAAHIERDLDRLQRTGRITSWQRICDETGWWRVTDADGTSALAHLDHARAYCEASLARSQTSWTMWALDNGRNLSPVGSQQYVSMHQLPGDIVPVAISQVPDDDPAGTHWGWINEEGRLQPALIWPTRAQFDMCFPYGPAVETEEGKGHVVHLRVQPIPPETPVTEIPSGAHDAR